MTYQLKRQASGETKALFKTDPERIVRWKDDQGKECQQYAYQNYADLSPANQGRWSAANETSYNMLDLDIDPLHGQTPAQLMQQVDLACEESGLPRATWILATGKGVHAHFVTTAPVQLLDVKETWRGLLGLVVLSLGMEPGKTLALKLNECHGGRTAPAHGLPLKKDPSKRAGNIGGTSFAMRFEDLRAAVEMAVNKLSPDIQQIICPIEALPTPVIAADPKTTASQKFMQRARVALDQLNPDGLAHQELWELSEATAGSDIEHGGGGTELFQQFLGRFGDHAQAKKYAKPKGKYQKGGKALTGILRGLTLWPDDLPLRSIDNRVPLNAVAAPVGTAEPDPEPVHEPPAAGEDPVERFDGGDDGDGDGDQQLPPGVTRVNEAAPQPKIMDEEEENIEDLELVENAPIRDVHLEDMDRNDPAFWRKALVESGSIAEPLRMEYILGKILARDSINLITGEDSSGKTSLVLAWGGAQWRGETELCGQPIAPGVGPLVVVTTGEQTDGQMQVIARRTRCGRSVSVRNPDVSEGAPKFVSRFQQFYSEVAPASYRNEAEFWEALGHARAKWPDGVFLIDCAQSVFSWADLNSAQDCRRIISGLLRIGGTICLIHHHNKGEAKSNSADKVRGSKALVDGCHRLITCVSERMGETRVQCRRRGWEGTITLETPWMGNMDGSGPAEVEPSPMEKILAWFDANRDFVVEATGAEAFKLYQGEGGRASRSSFFRCRKTWDVNGKVKEGQQEWEAKAEAEQSDEPAQPEIPLD